MNNKQELKRLFLTQEWERCLPILREEVYRLAGACSPEIITGMKKIIEMPEEAYKELKRD